ncbi:right-handed parallel beta-helix repeat-containing protein [Persicitalea sp.]|uniref:right-handed parallel beta-helix repeat-containing protein n=1 Tax=Persicitalea sp. TaxID=3100273 RepID=UPI0035931CDD
MKTFLIPIVATVLVGLLQSCTQDADSPTVVTPAVPPPTTGLVFYVSATAGSDSRTADQARNAATPWKTIQKGVSSIPGGAILMIAGGTYPEKVVVPVSANGKATTPTLIKSKDGETAVLEGNNAGVQWEALFLLKDNQHITVKGLKAQNGFWYGFSGESSTNIAFDSCSTFNTRASGIYIKTSSALTIRRNNIRKACQELNRDASGNGTQECITVTNCHDFTVSDNEVWDGLTVDTPGGEGIDAKGGSYNGEISRNYVHDLYELGIYLDAGSKESYNIRVHSNRLFKTGGLSVAGELGGHARDIYFYNNVVAKSRSSGVTFQSIGNGKFSNVYIVNNTFYNNAQTGFAGDISNFSKNTGNNNLVIRNNIFYNKTANYRHSIWHDLAAPHLISHNLYFDFKASNNAANSFQTTNLTAADMQADPQFTNPVTNDFALKATSPALKKGMPISLPGSAAPLFTTDFLGKPRGTTSWDLGAFTN